MPVKLLRRLLRAPLRNVYPKFSVDFSWAMMTVKIIRFSEKRGFRVQVWGK